MTVNVNLIAKYVKLTDVAKTMIVNDPKLRLKLYPILNIKHKRISEIANANEPNNRLTLIACIEVICEHCSLNQDQVIVYE